jgi:hypothetical protein
MGVFLFEIPNGGIGAARAGGFPIFRRATRLVQRSGRS